MGFNFGAFLGGMSEQISENIESAKEFQREKDFRLEMLAEEEATKMRLAKASERREQRRRDKENASVLKAVGYTDAQAGWIMQGGNATVELYSNFAKQAYARGIAPSSILGSNLINSDHQDPRNEAALMSVIDSTRPEVDPTDQPFTIRQDIMTSVLQDIEKPKEPKEYTSLAAGYSGTFTQLQNAKERGDEREVARLEDVLEEWKVQIEEDIARRKPDEKPEKPIEYFSKTSRETIKKNALTDAYTLYEFETDGITGNITANLEGRTGPKLVARMAAADTLERQAKVAEGVVDVNLMGEADAMREESKRLLTRYGQNIVTQSGGTEGSPTKKFGYLQTTKETAIGNYEMYKNGNSGQYKVGDVIVGLVKEADGSEVFRVYVYTGRKSPEDRGLSDGERTLYNFFHDAGRLF